MKIIKQAIIGAVALSFASAIHTYAIEGLKISVPSTNVVLSWPSDPSETYIIQYRNTLSATDSWTTLADYYPADSSTNITFFVDSNPVQYGSSASGGSSFAAMTTAANGMSLATSAAETPPPAPMVIPANGSGGAVPLALYPPCFDLTGFLILDPATGETVNGAGYLMQALSPLSAPANGLQAMDSGSGGGFSPSPMGGPAPDGGSGGTAQEPGTGFYRVVRDGAHLYGITNGATLSGIVRIPVELANGSGTVSTMSLTENDSPVGNSVQTAPLASLALIVDTTQMANGDHQVSASARWEDTNGGIWEADSPPITVTVSNEVSFENWMPQFGELGNSLLIRATSAHPDTDWYIDVYDSHYSYIGTFGGHTYDGDITVAWNLIGPDNVVHTNDNFFIFKVSTQYIDPPSPKTFKHWEQWSGHGAWVAVAQHAWDSYHDVDLLYGELSGFIGGALGQSWPVLPSPQGQNDYGSYLAYGLTFGSGNPQGDTDWHNFRNALYDSRSRNLVYFGHGGPTGLGYDTTSTNRFISATEIGNMLHTIPIGQTNSHSFRFAFLDGCSTAKGNLPEALGMIHRENVDGSDYANASMRYSAFVGWPADKMIGFLSGGGYISYDHVNYIVNIQTWMLLGQPIKQAISSAAAASGGSFSASSLKVYGYWGLGFGTQN